MATFDTLATRIAHIRTWTFVANRADWLADPEHWRQRTRAIEDQLSDALHEQLTQRFVDKRTSVLMRRLRDDDDLAATIADDGKITVEEHYVGRLSGFVFEPDLAADGVQGKAARNAAQPAVAKEMAMRTRRVASAKSDAFKIARNGRVLWRGEEIARLEKSDEPLRPNLVLIADESLQAGDRERVVQRLETWLDEHLSEKLKPLIGLGKAEDVTGLARGIAFRLKESFGIVKREAIADEVKQLDQEARAQLRKYGVRFGAFNIHFPLLLKPASSELLLLLWALWQGDRESNGLEGQPEPPRPGLTSVPAQAGVPETFYRVAGYHLCGPRAVRIDMLERLADMIRPLIAWRPKRGFADGTAHGRERRRRFHDPARDDVHPRLQLGRARRGAEGARLPARPEAGTAKAGRTCRCARPLCRTAGRASCRRQSGGGVRRRARIDRIGNSGGHRRDCGAAGDCRSGRARVHRHLAPATALRRQPARSAASPSPPPSPDSDGGPFRRHRGSSRHGRWRGRSAIR